MSQTATTSTTPTCKPLVGFTLPCPLCGQIDAGIAVNLSSLNEDGSGDEFFCNACDGVFGRALINAILTRWPAIIRWVEAVPQFESQE